jgi:hypothetical protein
VHFVTNFDPRQAFCVWERSRARRDIIATQNPMSLFARLSSSVCNATATRAFRASAKALIDDRKKKPDWDLNRPLTKQRRSKVPIERVAGEWRRCVTRVEASVFSRSRDSWRVQVQRRQKLPHCSISNR